MALRSARTLIRPWQRSDEHLAAAWPPYGDPIEPLWNLPRQNGIFHTWQGTFDLAGTRRTWAVENLSGQLIGRISLREIDERRGLARLGVTFGAPFVGKGLGSEALRVFIEHFFRRMHFEAMLLDVAAPNQRAVRCYERLGFERVGTDWRAANRSFDRRMLAQPGYAALRRFFREEGGKVWVLFYEMELRCAAWTARMGDRETGLWIS